MNTVDFRARILAYIGVAVADKLDLFLAEMSQNHGITHFPHNQIVIAEISQELSSEIYQATGGATDVSGKRYAFEASKLFHEINSHSDQTKETLRGQISYGTEDIYRIIDTMIAPDVIEDVSHGDSLDQRNTFAVIKVSEECVVVVLSVGGKRNPNVTPQQVIMFQRTYWENLMEKGKTVREIIYANSAKRSGEDSDMIEIIKKNRVTVAHRES